MLYIHTTDGFDIEWHVGEPVPKMWGKDKNAALERIAFIQADGDELLHVLKTARINLQSGDRLSRSVYKWYGDVARTIYLNL